MEVTVSEDLSIPLAASSEQGREKTGVVWDLVEAMMVVRSGPR